MYKNQLQELAQRSCFNLPSYSCIREGPDHAPRFKATVNFNGDVFESPNFCTTLRQAEHSAAEVALQSLSSRAPSHSLAARILDETGVYKNLLQEISQRVGAPLPSYSTYRSGLGHLPVFTCTVELAGIIFTGEPAKNKKQAEKNAALAAWSSLKKLAQQTASSSTEPEHNDEQEQITIARALLNYRLKEKMAMANNPNATPFPKKFPIQPDRRPSTAQQSTSTGSKILPLIRPISTPRVRPASPATNDKSSPAPAFAQPESRNAIRPQKFPAAGAAPYVPVRRYTGNPSPYRGMAPPVTIRTAVPCFSAPPLPPQIGHQLPQVMAPTVKCMAPPVHIRQAIPVFAAPTPVPASPVQVKDPPGFLPSAKEPQQDIALQTKEPQQAPLPELPKVPAAAPAPAKQSTAAKVEEHAVELPQANVVAPTKIDPPAKEIATVVVPGPKLIDAMDSSVGDAVLKDLKHLDLKSESARV